MSTGFHDIGIECPQPPAIERSLTYEGPIRLSVGNNFLGECSVGAFTYFNTGGSFSQISIGRFCSIAEEVVMAPGQHHTSGFSTHPFIYDPDDGSAKLSHFESYRKILGKKKPTFSTEARRINAPPGVTIGHDVWVGQRAMILNGVVVGHGAVIAAGAIVTRDVAPYSVVAGVPARPIRMRFEAAIVEDLLSLCWWDYDLSEVSNQVDFGKPVEVIRFMREKLRLGRLQRFRPPQWKLESVDGKGKVTRLRT